MKPRIALVFSGFAALLLGIASDAMAQRGVGDPTGVARQAVKPPVVTLTGEVVEVKTEPCINTTGRFPIGTHMVVKTSEGKTLNVHLGPAVVVADTAAKLTTGQKVTVEAFRTEKMAEDHYTAVVLKLGDETIRLRDETLRPLWAGVGRAWGGTTGAQQGRPWGDSGRGQWAPGRGPRGGQGARGMGRGGGYRWQSRRGAGWGYGRGRGRGW